MGTQRLWNYITVVAAAVTVAVAVAEVTVAVEAVVTAVVVADATVAEESWQPAQVLDRSQRPE